MAKKLSEGLSRQRILILNLFDISLKDIEDIKFFVGVYLEWKLNTNNDFKEVQKYDIQLLGKIIGIELIVLKNKA